MATVIVKHVKVSPVLGGTNPNLVYGPDWNSNHVVTGLENVPNIDTTNASNITSGTLPAACLPTPTLTTLGGVEAANVVSHSWINSISTSGVPSLSQPAAADLSNGVTGTGAVVLATSPTLVTPAIGAATASSLTVSGAVTSTVNNTGSSPLGSFIASSPNVSYFWNVTGQPLDQGNWDAAAALNVLQFRAVNDANTVANPWMTVTRGSGATVSGVSIGVPLAALNISLTSGAGFTQPFLSTSALSGSGSAPTGSTPNLFFITSDTYAGGAGFVNGMSVSHVFGGAAATGGRQAFSSFLQLSAATSASNTNRNYVGAELVGFATSGDGGTNTGAGAKGGIFGSSSWGDLQNTATNFLGVSATELNVSIRTGASAKYKTILQLSEHAFDAISGASVDAALAITAQSGAVGLNHCILFTDMSGVGPTKSTGTLIGSSVPNSTSLQAAHGIDLSGYTFSTDAIKTPGFIVGTTGFVSMTGGLNISSPTSTSSATGGGASALPALPSTYITIQINGSNFKIPIYNT